MADFIPVDDQPLAPDHHQDHQQQQQLIITQAHGYAAHDSSGILTPFSFTRRATGPNDVRFKITHCGVCHSDLHQIRNEWTYSCIYPMVPGHEIVGIVTEVGPRVSKLKAGDRVGMGPMAASCGGCDECGGGAEQFCDRAVFTYNCAAPDGRPMYGGFSDVMVAHEKFVLRIPEGLELAGAAPLLCAGVTVYSPMRYYGMTEPGKRLAVVGLGGLGHMAVKFGVAFGLHVTVVSTSPAKEPEARLVLGAHRFLLSSDPRAMQEASKSMDYVLDTVATPHDVEPFLALLKVNGKMVILNLVHKAFSLLPATLVFGRRCIGGSFIGSIRETQEMLDFCAEKKISAEIELIDAAYLNTAMDRIARSDVKYRFVVDIQGSNLAG